MREQMDQIDILLKEYGNLFQEKLIHKQSIRKLKGYISYLTSILSLSLTFMGISTTDFFKSVSSENGIPYLVSHFSDIFILISIPFTPIVLLVASFAVNDLFQIYVIGTQIGNIEKKINDIAKSNLLLWEHHICPVVYGGGQIEKMRPVKNVIALSDAYIFFPFVYSLIIVTLFFGGRYIALKNMGLYALFAVINLYFLGAFLWVGKALLNVVKADSSLTVVMKDLNSVSQKQADVTEK
jgi:hypothetical protein